MADTDGTPSAVPGEHEPSEAATATTSAAHDRRRNLVIVIVIVIAVIGPLGWGAAYLAWGGKDSGIAACEVMRDGTGTGAGQGSDQLTEAQYQHIRKMFKDSRHPEIKHEGTRLVDLYWQMQNTGAGEDLGTLAYLGPLTEHTVGLQAACRDHGVTVNITGSGVSEAEPGLDPGSTAAASEPVSGPVGATVTMDGSGDPATTLAVTNMWTRCVLIVPQVDLNYDDTLEDIKPGTGNRFCVAKFRVKNVGTVPGFYAGEEQLVTSAGTYASTGTAPDLAGGLRPVEGDDLDAGAVFNPGQTAYAFGAWEVPDSATIQAVRFEDGQLVTVKAERRAKL